MLTIVTPAADRNLLTPEEMRAAAGLADSNTSQDVALAALNAEISAIITSALRISRAGASPPTLRSETVMETFRRDCSDGEIWLSRFPVTSISSFSWGDTVLTAPGYELDASIGGLVRLNGTRQLNWGNGAYSITYTAGWIDVPVEIKSAAKRMVTGFRSETARDPSLRRLEIPGVATREWWVGPNNDPLISGEVMEMLRPFVNHAREPA